MSISLGLAALVASIIAGVAGTTSSVWSSYNQKAAQEEANKTNIDLAREANQAQLQQVRETNEFNAAQAQIDRDRQDTTMQRAMADYSAAGLNPLLAVSGSTSQYSSPTAAQGNVASIQRAHVDPAALDFSGMASAFSSMSNAMLVNAILSRNADLKANTSALNRASREAIAAANRSNAHIYHTSYYNKYGQLTGRVVKKGL